MSLATDIPSELMLAYMRQWRELRGHLARRVGSRDLADEALQETWLRLAGMREQPVGVRDNHAFLLRIAGNIAIDLLRRERRHAMRCISDEAVLREIADLAPSPEAYALHRDELRALVMALAELPAKPRAALLMNRCDGMSHAQVAARLKVSESMVAKYLAQALRHCRDHLRAMG
ncbi:FecI-like protein [Azorhizobium caulinodans ORS 571]|uniref:FecI-like protein n=1 Tax=Azorhizobium caulinodans (strain ATCC 43989 / DSM 5975 / JCM 20966 / LMG 6465 / NBRC 14845 / NCIMB 13405 / ORS 571) TaxID=438753 RepID=A8HWH2_AZOC5|nr:RNA polymerase sigma factor [Azorhizobium caulinodans]BAF90429.1 FecI-like protein [Azorhizobium caulinodans ORS 571]